MSGTDLRDRVAEFAAGVGFAIVDEAQIPARPAALSPIPAELHSGLRQRLQDTQGGNLYQHQALAVEHFLAGKDVCLATATASGKSLAFIACVVDCLLKRPGTTALALYPAKALIQDQIAKWHEIAEPLGVTIGFIDGSVPVKFRERIVTSSRILLMTPDVVHAWLMNPIARSHAAPFLQSLAALVLDETHAYDGVFGTNMAYLMRRLAAASGCFQIVSSTATISDPDGFIEDLTGRRPVALGAADDGSPAHTKSIFELQAAPGSEFEAMARLVAKLAEQGPTFGRFIAFADSRKLVERLVATAGRLQQDDEDPEEDEPEEGPWPMEEGGNEHLLPYRAGYEEEDRINIQRALERGALQGVVATSALELGIDIGDVRTVVLLGRPRSASSLWQRIGRAGRRSEGIGLIMRGRELDARPLREYLQQSFAANRLYLKNRYVQYAHALCAAAEIGATGRGVLHGSFKTLPSEFSKMVDNELQQTEAVAADLYPLKQRAQEGAHYAFPLRSAGEQSFKIVGPATMQLGNVNLSQALREAYPGAVYYYMARPYRVSAVQFRAGRILCRRERHYTTAPLSQSKVFPRFTGGLLQLWKSESGFVAETQMQVSERVVGFTEQRGKAKTTYSYGPGSPYSQREMSRFFETTGICWWFAGNVGVSESMALLIQGAFSELFEVQARDLGSGLFFSKTSPLSAEVCRGACIYDSTSGSLRLTSELVENFATVVGALREAREGGEPHPSVQRELEEIEALARGLKPVPVADGDATPTVEGESALVVCPGQKALLWHASGQVEEVTVLGIRYTPQGLFYDLEPKRVGTRWAVPVKIVQPIAGETRMARFNPMTGDSEPVDEAAG